MDIVRQAETMGRSSVVDRIIELDSMTGADSSDPRTLNGPSSAFIGFLETHKDLPDPFFSPSPEGHVITGWDLDGLDATVILEFDSSGSVEYAVVPKQFAKRGSKNLRWTKPLRGIGG